MSFTKLEVLQNWDREGLDIVQDLAKRWGYEALPDPVNGDTLQDYMRRLHGVGLVHLSGNMRDQRDVRARVAAEDEDVPIYQMLSDEEMAVEAETEALEEASAELRATDPAARFAAYKANREAITGIPGAPPPQPPVKLTGTVVFDEPQFVEE